MRKEFKDFIIKNLALPEEDSQVLAESAKYNTYVETKSKNPVIRLFYFIIGMLLVLIWNIYEKPKITFKKFVIVLSESLSQQAMPGGEY